MAALPRRPLQANVVLVVDPPPVADHPALIEKERLGGPFGAEAIGDDVADILEKREGNLVIAAIAGQVGGVSYWLAWMPTTPTPRSW